MSSEVRQYEYRGWRITPFEGTETGHKLPGSRQVLQRAGIRTHRRISGYEVHYPEGGTKYVKTMKEARRYIDDYIG